MSEVIIQKFSFPFSCSSQPCQPEATPTKSPARPTVPSTQSPSQEERLNHRSLPDPAQLSQPRTAGGLQNGTPGGSEPAPAEGGPPPSSSQVPQLVPRGSSPRPGVLEPQAEGAEDQRPAAKRQLSSDSSARTVGVLKKTALRKAGEARPGPPPRARGLQGPEGSISRGRRKDLGPSTGVFLRVDAHAFQAGMELKEQCVCSVATIARSITQGGWGELERLRAIWVWLCNNIEYDLSGYLGQTEKLCSPEEVVAAGRAVCGGYASLCLALCREVGVQCQQVPGFSKGIGYQQGRSLRGTRSDHMWNAVQLGGRWFLLDACWGAGRVDMDTKNFIKRMDDFYFLTEPEDFIGSHFPDEQRWQLLDDPLALEDFERSVFRTSRFYTLGLSLLHPRHALILTEEGEASVSVGSKRPVSFTYEVAPTGGRDEGMAGPRQSVGEAPEEASWGLLTVTPRGMKLHLLPPASGTYRVKLFARPADDADATFLWVCSFTLQCPVARAREEIPDNPFLSWGLQPSAGALGVEACSQCSQVAELEGGRLELVLQTSRPLMLLWELAHPGLEPALSRRCLAAQVEPQRLTCHVLCPRTGFYRLSLFLRDYGKTDGEFQNAGNFLLHCARGAVGLDELFPPSLSSCCGPGTRTLAAGLSRFSHAGALVSTQQGRCNLTFHTRADLELHATLSREESPPPATAPPLSRHLLCTYTDSKVTLSASLPRPGVYRLGLYARDGPEGDFRPLCDFVLKNGSQQPGPPFPCVYAAWRRGCVLLEPRSGRLEEAAGSWVRFRVKVPGARRVAVLGGEGTAELRQNRSRVWEGEALTGSGQSQLRLVAVTGESADTAVLLTFDLHEQQKEEG
ncbi:kyphoscoliosis peptidase [Osmerus mordax]|uniref:kyphoscoliosis peptidase n=1 Tax=Osmerus mordax TaxID=8014 RepID=UPI00350EEB3D